MKLFDRKLMDRIRPWLDKPDIIVVTGARQVGKTSLLELIKGEISRKYGTKKNILSFNMENGEQLSALNGEPRYFKEYCIFSGADPDKDSVVLIDEVQYLDDPSHFLKYIADLEPSIKLIITGSTSITIKKFKDGVTGRKKTFTLFPLDFYEFLEFKNRKNLQIVATKFNFRKQGVDELKIDPERIKPMQEEAWSLFEEFIKYGGYPKVVLADSEIEKIEELRELYEAYELKDVNILFNITNITAFRNLFRVIAGSIGNLVNINEISGTIGIGRDTVRRYLSILENSYIISTVQPFHSNIRKEVTKMPKVFFVDTGLRNYAVRNFTEFNYRQDKGPLYENAIFCELCKNLDILDQLYFWRTVSKNEVDFILTGEKKRAFEVKTSVGPKMKKPVGLKAFMKIYKGFEPIVVTVNRFDQQDEIRYLPGWMV